MKIEVLGVLSVVYVAASFAPGVFRRHVPDGDRKESRPEQVAHTLMDCKRGESGKRWHSMNVSRDRTNTLGLARRLRTERK